MEKKVFKKIKTKEGNTLMLTNYDRKGVVGNGYVCFWQFNKKMEEKKYMCYPTRKGANQAFESVKEYENKEGIWAE